MKVDVVAKYIRLSDEDVDTGRGVKQESDSVVSQRRLLDGFIDGDGELRKCRIIEFCDDGFSGTDFRRPGFAGMMEAVKQGEVGCIIVKDFSRLGRDYIEVGSYLEQIFPLMEVRCISVNDRYDSEGVLGTAGGLNVAFKNLINMLYSRDLSKKIRSAQMARARKGECLGGFARYGYEKSLEDKHRLVVDPEAAEVVRKIFTMAAEGITISGIVRYLNDNGVLTCVEYKQRKDSRYQHPGGGVKKLWGTQSVRSILSDETYIGKVVWNRSEKSITTGKKMLWHDRSEWVVVDGQHEPLVSEELFALANERAKPKKRDRSGVDMSGFKREVLFVCGYCGRSMVKKNHKYCCRYRTCGSDTECRRAVEDMETLEGSVMEYVRKTAEVMLGNSGRKDVEAERETLEKKLDALRKEKERLSAEKMFLYDKYRSGGMTREQFKARTGSMGVRVEEIGKEMGEAEDGIERLKGCGSRDGETVLEGIAALREFDKGVLRKGIERIRVFGEGRIEVDLEGWGYVWRGRFVKIVRKIDGAMSGVLVALLVLGYNSCGCEKCNCFCLKRSWIKERGETVTKTELIDMLDEYKMGLLSKATDGTIDDKYYIQTRNALLENVSIKEQIPKFIRSCRTADEFRRYMQNESGNYAGRRTLITDSINRLIEYIEEHSDEEADPFSQIKQYKRVEQIGYGGFGSVFKYHNACLDMDFAVKVYSPIFVSSDEQREGERRFFREAKMLFQLNHMNIVKIYDAGRISEGPFIRMEYIEGYDLNGLQKKYGMLSFEYSVKVIKPILNGLRYAHGKGIIHRDLKPSNVVFSTREKIFKIIDFGVSAFLDTENNTKLTKTGEAVAGGAFIDPLLQENPKLRDCRSDIYSIGAIWYWLLCGRAPHGSDMRTYLSNAAPDLLDKQINIVMKCLAGNLEDRYGDCGELLAIIS